MTDIVGTRRQVWKGLADITPTKLTKQDFTLNTKGKIVSKALSNLNKQRSNLGKHLIPKKCT